jgi:threonine dehydratase
VSEDGIKRAIAALVDEEHVVAEGAGAAAVGAVAERKVTSVDGPIVAIVSGANIDLEKLVPLLR